MIIGMIDLMQDSNKGINDAVYITATLLLVLNIFYWLFRRDNLYKFLAFFSDDNIDIDKRVPVKNHLVA